MRPYTCPEAVSACDCQVLYIKTFTGSGKYSVLEKRVLCVGLGPVTKIHSAHQQGLFKCTKVLAIDSVVEQLQAGNSSLQVQLF